MQFYAPTDKAAPILRPSFFTGGSVAVVNQSDEDVYMSDNPAELDASSTGYPVVGGIRVAANGGQVLWPATAKIAWFRAMMPWAAGNFVFGNVIIDRFGNVWDVTTPASGAAAAASGASYPFPTTPAAEAALIPNVSTQADGAVTWTFRGLEAIALNVQPG